MSHQLHDKITVTTQKFRTQVFQIRNITDTLCGENCESSTWVQVSL